MPTEPIIIAVIPLLIAILGAVFGITRELHDRKPQSFPPQIEYNHFNFKPRKLLTEREKSDLYQDMAWWDREFNKLCGIPEPKPVDPFVVSMTRMAEAVQLAVSTSRGYGTPTVEEIGSATNITYMSDVLTEKEYQDELEAFMRTKNTQRGRVSGRGPVMTLEDFMDIKPLREGKMVVRCNCGGESCRGWAEIFDDEPWGHRPWEAPIDFIGPLEKDFTNV